MLQVTVAEVNRAAAHTIGLNFNIFNKHGGQVVASNAGGIVPVLGNESFARFVPSTQTVTGLGTSVLGNIPVALDNGQIQLAISALRELNYSRYLAEPTLTTMNGQTASFQAGGLFPIPFLTTGNLNTSILQGVGYIPTGVQLNFTPFITDKDRIRLQIAAEVSDRDPNLGSTIIAGSEVPSLITRNFQTTVELREGQTLAVAGLIQNRLSANSNRVPFFGDLAAA
jgi:pilus assembly protein CpaC